MKTHHSSLASAVRIALIASASVLIAHSATAANYTWQGGTGSSAGTGGNGTWNASNTNWTDASATRNQTWSDGNTALFGASSNGTYTVTVGSNVAAAGISFTVGGAAYSLNGGNITIADGGTISYGVSGNNNSTLNSALLGNNVNIAGFGASAIISGNNTGLTGTVTVNFTGAGSRTVSLTHANAFGSGTAVNISSTGTTFNLGNNTLAADVSFNAGALSLSSGSILRARGNGTMTYTGAVTLGGNAAFQTIAGANTKLVISNTVSLGSNSLSLEAGNAGQGFEIQGAIDGAGSVTKTGNRTVTLSAANSYSGNTTVSAGTLLLTGVGSINTSSLVTVAGGATLTNNTATALTAPLALSENATINGSGLITTTNLTVAADLTGGTFTSINSTGSFAASGALAFTLTNPTEGTFNLLSTAPASFSFTTVSINGFSLVDSGGGLFTGNVGGLDYSFTNGAAVLTAAVPEPGTWVLIGLGLGFTLFRMSANSRRQKRLSGQID